MLNNSPLVRCANLAARQHGVISRTQALKCGMTRTMIGTQLRNGIWEALYPGVYVLAGAKANWLTKVSGAVIGCGPPTAASHRTAASLLGFDGFSPGPVEVTCPRNLRWKGVIAYRGTLMVPRDIRNVQGIPTTPATKTLIGLGSVVDEVRLEAALDFALVRGLTSVSYLDRQLQENPRRPGTAALRRLLAIRTQQPPTESELERLYHRRVTLQFHLPVPMFQFRVLKADPPRRIDFAYPELALGVEVLGWRVHGRHQVWQRDLNRHNQLINLGWELLYFSWIDVVDGSQRVAAEVKAAIARRNCLFL